MSKLLALKSGFHEILPDALTGDFSKLKQQALFFDHIGILELNQLYTAARGKIKSSKIPLEPNLENKVETMFLELEWLRQTGIIYELDIRAEIQTQQLKDMAKNISPQKFEELAILSYKLIDIEKSYLNLSDPKVNKAELGKEQRFAVLRLMAILTELEKGDTVVTTLPHTEYNYALPSSSKNDVAQIVINKLPLPGNETPWEQIIDYRNDEDNQKNLLALRRWIRKISTENLSSSEIEDELQWLMNDFHNHMKVHKMKTNTETLEVIVKAPLEIIEDLVKLKFSKIPEPFFAIKKRQINLMEIELNAPGKEISYIVKTQEAFQSE